MNSQRTATNYLMAFFSLVAVAMIIGTMITQDGGTDSAPPAGNNVRGSSIGSGGVGFPGISTDEEEGARYGNLTSIAYSGNPNGPWPECLGLTEEECEALIDCQMMDKMTGRPSCQYSVSDGIGPSHIVGGSTGNTASRRTVQILVRKGIVVDPAPMIISD